MNHILCIFHLTRRGAILLLVGDSVPRDVERGVDVALVGADVVVVEHPGHGAARALHHVLRHGRVHAVIVPTVGATHGAVGSFLENNAYTSYYNTNKKKGF